MPGHVLQETSSGSLCGEGQIPVPQGKFWDNSWGGGGGENEDILRKTALLDRK